MLAVICQHGMAHAQCQSHRSGGRGLPRLHASRRVIERRIHLKFGWIYCPLAQATVASCSSKADRRITAPASCVIGCPAATSQSLPPMKIEAACRPSASNARSMSDLDNGRRVTFTVEEAARLLVSVAPRLTECVRSGELPSVKIFLECFPGQSQPLIVAACGRS